MRHRSGDMDRPPCFDCEMPTLMAANADAWRVFFVCCSQMRVVGMGTPMGIEFSAIDRAMDHCGIHELDRGEVFEKTRLVGEAYAKLCRDRQDEDQRARDAKNKQPTRKSVVMFPPGTVKMTKKPVDGDAGLFPK